MLVLVPTRELASQIEEMVALLGAAPRVRDPDPPARPTDAAARAKLWVTRRAETDAARGQAVGAVAGSGRFR